MRSHKSNGCTAGLSSAPFMGLPAQQCRARPSGRVTQSPELCPELMRSVRVTRRERRGWTAAGEAPFTGLTTGERYAQRSVNIVAGLKPDWRAPILEPAGGDRHELSPEGVQRN